MAAGGITPIPLSDLKQLPQSYQLWFLRIKDILDQSLTDVIPWSQINTSGSNLTDITTRLHSSLQSIVGSSDAYHLSQAQYETINTLSTKTTNYTATSTDGIILVDATSGVVTITLPAASTRKELHIKKIDASANAVTISRAGSDTIEGSTSKSLAAQYNSYTIYSDGSTTWYIKAST